MSENDRITPYKDGGKIEDRVDEIVATAPFSVHFEMMSGSSAWMRVGLEIFWLHADKGKLICRHGETWPERYAVPLPTPCGHEGER